MEKGSNRDGAMTAGTYETLDGRIMAVEVMAVPVFRAGKPRSLGLVVPHTKCGIPQQMAGVFW
jgi:hypothetical protein